jgi:hypothetical protein
MAVLLLASARADAGLAVTLKVNNHNVDLIPLFAGSGTPDNNASDKPGFVAVAGFGINVDDTGGLFAPDFFVDALSVFSSKNANQGMLETINWSARYAGQIAVPVVIEVWDLFSVPVTSVGTTLDVSSTFSSVNDNLASPITLDSYLDDQFAGSVEVESASDIPSTQSVEVDTKSYPFELLSRFSFMLKPNSEVSFRAQTSATLVAATTAHAPELASLFAWSAMIGLAGLVYAYRRRRAA